MRCAELFVRCLENEGVEYIFGTPWEENLDVMDALLDSSIKFITVKWHPDRRFGRDSHINFNNPDYVKYAESFGARGFRVESPDQLQSVLKEALQCGTVAVVDCPVDYSENMKLTEKLGELVCPI